MQREQKHEEVVELDSWPCPSFSAYSSDKLADIADQITRDDFRAQNDNRFEFDTKDDDGNRHENDDRGDSDFEFVAFRKASDGVFFDGGVGPVFPIFNRDILTERESDGRDSTAELEKEDVMALRFPMGKLLIGDEDKRSHPDPPSSSSSSEVDDLEAIPEGTYCVWTPNPVQASPGRCKKSNSTGSSSSKRWKLLDLLRRSNSDGKDSFVFLTPSPSSSSSATNSAKKKGIKAENSKAGAGKKGSGGEKKVAAKGSGSAGGEKKVSAHEALYVRNRELRRVDRRRSYLPYRQDLVGFFASLNGMGRAFPSF